jgi:hypothetical protein
MKQSTTIHHLGLRILALTGAACLPALAFVLPGCGDDDGLASICIDWPNPKPCATTASTGSGTGVGDPNAECPSANDAAPYLCRSENFEAVRREGDQCCYDYQAGSGRPFIVDGVARMARARTRASAHARPVEAAARTRLADAWVRDGLAEHASVASFSRLALELLSLGAPMELVADASRAALDEVRHADFCFALAARYGRPVVPERLDLGGSVPIAPTLEALVTSTFQEGCVGETLAAALLAERAAGAADDDVRRALERMAEEEARHAELSWRVVAWARAEGGAAVGALLDRLAADLFRTGASLGADDDDLGLDAGWLDGTSRQAVERHVVHDILVPAALALGRGPDQGTAASGGNALPLPTS